MGLFNKWFEWCGQLARLKAASILSVNGVQSVAARHSRVDVLPSNNAAGESLTVQLALDEVASVLVPNIYEAELVVRTIRTRYVDAVVAFISRM